MSFLATVKSFVSCRTVRLVVVFVVLVILSWASAGMLLAAISVLNELPFRTSEAAMMTGEGDFIVLPLLTIGETLSGTTGALNSSTAGAYTPPGVLDGIGGYALDANTARLFVNHELGSTAGYTYTVSDGLGGTVVLSGARVSYFDIDRSSKQITDSGLAYDAIYDRASNRVTTTVQLDGPGFDRFCSAALFEAEQFGSGQGLANRIFFTGEETSSGSGGTEWALDVAKGDLWAAPEMGRGAWENVAELNPGDTTHVAFLLGDDTAESPLYLYVGQKGGAGDNDFLDNNGLKSGQLYVWGSDTGELDPRVFSGTGTITGSWLALEARNVISAGTPGYDALGYKDNATLQAEADGLGAFSFSRPEDVSTNPADGTQAVLASTGRSSIFDGADSLGTVYLVDVDFTDINSPTASLEILYDGDADPNQALRSPDNVDWADDGYIYVQEDRSFDDAFGSTAANPNEASIVRLDPASGAPERVAEMNRSAVPAGLTDSDPTDVGNWESSGILDVSSLFGQDPGNLFLFDVQAHSITDGIIASANLVQSGQLAFLVKAEQRVYLPLIDKN